MGYQFPTSIDDVNLLEAFYQARARESFWAFRQYMRPKLKKGWFHRELAEELEQFGRQLIAGLAPVLLVQAPPQHGKSWAVVDLVAWIAGLDPDRQAIYSSFSERLGVRANLMLQRMYDSEKYKAVFPDTRISERNAVTISGQTLRNREILEYVGREGYFRNTTVRGSITGEGLGFGIIDDPIKGREEANSETMRNKTWEWFTDDFMTRFTEDAGVLGIMTRWHIDDPFGRLIKARPEARVLRYQAIATQDEKHRREGEVLFPQHKSLQFLNRQKSTLGTASWESLYQQNPIVAGGNLFKDEWWKFLDVPPPIEYRAIFVDTAQKTNQVNDYSVLECWGKTVTGQAVLLDIERGKWEAPALLERSRAFWDKHKVIKGLGPLRKMGVEDKVSGTGLIQTLKLEGIPVLPIQRGVDKVTRAMDVSPYVESGNVILLRGIPHLNDFLSETAAFPNGAHDDLVDPAMDAISEMCGQSKKKKVTF